MRAEVAVVVVMAHTLKVTAMDTLRMAMDEEVPVPFSPMAAMAMVVAMNTGKDLFFDAI
jgi:hypothetical protein